MKDRDKTIKALIALLFLIPAMAWYAFVLTKLWGWFVQSIFDVRNITLAEAYGLSMIASLLLLTVKRKDGEALTTVVGELVASTMFLLIGWGVHWLVVQGL